MKTNPNFAELKDSYLFSSVAKKIKDFQAENPDTEIIRLGIGDVTRPIPKCITRAIVRAVKQQSRTKNFRGYGDEQGYMFLRQAIAGYYAERLEKAAPFATQSAAVLSGVTADEIFISDGAKSDLGNILEIFDRPTVVIPNPVYPAYVDANVMAGNKILYADASAENNFLPMPTDIRAEPDVIPDIIYICSPNNPTGAVYTREQLAEWVGFALQNKAVILFDSAYAAFISNPSLPRSIYEIPGAKSCCIEISSFSKMAGFTGLRCGWTVVPNEVMSGETSLNKLWLRRQSVKFNGASYPIQCGAAAALSKRGMRAAMKHIKYYKQNAKIIADTFRELDIEFTGGRDAPYIWLKCPNGMLSWDLFDRLLVNFGIVGTPGAGFGSNGEGRFRLSAFGRRKDIIKAMELLKKN